MSRIAFFVVLFICISVVAGCEQQTPGQRPGDNRHTGVNYTRTAKNYTEYGRTCPFEWCCYGGVWVVLEPVDVDLQPFKDAKFITQLKPGMEFEASNEGMLPMPKLGRIIVLRPFSSEYKRGDVLTLLSPINLKNDLKNFNIEREDGSRAPLMLQRFKGVPIREEGGIFNSDQNKKDCERDSPSRDTACLGYIETQVEYKEWWVRGDFRHPDTGDYRTGWIKNPHKYLWGPRCESEETRPQFNHN